MADPTPEPCQVKRDCVQCGYMNECHLEKWVNVYRALRELSQDVPDLVIRFLLAHGWLKEGLAQLEEPEP